MLVRNRELTITTNWKSRESSKERGNANPYVLPTSPHWNPSWLSDVRATKKNLESEWLIKDNLETNPIMKPEAVSPVAGSPPGFSYPAALTQAPLPSKVSCFVNMCVSLDNSFPNVRRPHCWALERVPLPHNSYQHHLRVLKVQTLRPYPRSSEWESSF